MNKPIRADREFLRLSEVAAILGIGRSTAYKWVQEGRLPVVYRRPGGKYVPRSALAAFLEAEAETALDNTR